MPEETKKEETEEKVEEVKPKTFPVTCQQCKKEAELPRPPVISGNWWCASCDKILALKLKRHYEQFNGKD